jgi:hypothetical protein
MERTSAEVPSDTSALTLDGSGAGSCVFFWMSCDIVLSANGGFPVSDWKRTQPRP